MKYRYKKLLFDLDDIETISTYKKTYYETYYYIKIYFRSGYKKKIKFENKNERNKVFDKFNEMMGCSDFMDQMEEEDND